LVNRAAVLNYPAVHADPVRCNRGVLPGAQDRLTGTVGSLWTTLTPFIVAAALMPIELVITLALLGSPSRVRTAASAVAGMVTVRLLQGLLFGTVLHWGKRARDDGQTTWVLSAVLLVVAVILLVSVIREILSGQDPDDPPPKWLAALPTMTPGKAFLLGMGVILISVKLWVFTLAAINAIGQAGMSRTANMSTFVLFVILGVSTHLLIIAAAALFPQATRGPLDRCLLWLQRNNRAIMIALGLGFGSWFLYKGLHGLGIL
jgi:hypothetical protein